MKGIITALATPFKDDDIDYKSLDKLLDHQLNCSIKNISIAGTTGEGGSLEDHEFIRLISVAAKKAAGRAKIIAAINANITNKALKLANLAAENGADALLAVNPYYNKPTQKGIIAHYISLADLGLPLIIYNIPGRTSGEINDSSIAILARHPNIISIKECSGSLTKINDVRLAAQGELDLSSFSFLAGDDAAIIAASAMGSEGTFSIASNILPRTMLLLQSLCDKKDYSMALSLYNEIYPLLKALFIQTNPIPVKYLLKYAAVIESDEMRMPLMSLDEEYRIKLLEIIARINIKEVKDLFDK